MNDSNSFRSTPNCEKFDSFAMLSIEHSEYREGPIDGKQKRSFAFFLNDSVQTRAFLHLNAMHANRRLFSADDVLLLPNVHAINSQSVLRSRQIEVIVNARGSSDSDAKAVNQRKPPGESRNLLKAEDYFPSENLQTFTKATTVNSR